MTPAQADSYRFFTGRQDVIEAFDSLVSPAADRRILMVDGLSGTGKSFLAEWLRRFRCASIPTAKITLSPVFQEGDILQSIISQLDTKAAAEYSRLIGELEAKEREHPFVQLALSQSAEGRMGGSISNAQQTFQVSVGDAASVAEVQRRARRLDAFSKSIERLTSRPWVIFFDECEHLSQPELRTFILQVLIPRLQAAGPSLRLYLAGQVVPSEAFSAHESSQFHLAGFDLTETAQMLSKAGLTDTQLHRRVYDFTAGHPLLVAMWLEDALDPSQPPGYPPLPEQSLDEASCTRWIYDRIVNQFTDPTLRSFAANLCLLAWFDLSLIRAVFGAAISEQSFDQMVRRSFIKPYARRWRCHDIILKHLPAHRREIDPDECDAVQQRAEQALFKRLSTEQERTGTRFFPDRLLLSTAIIHSTSQISRQRTEEFVWSELALATAAFERDYLFGLARDLESRAAPPTLATLGNNTKRLLEQIGVGRLDSRSLQFVEALASAAEERQDKDSAQELYYFAAVTAAVLGSHPKARQLSEAACRLDPSLVNRIFYARCVARSGDPEKAHALLEAARNELGDSAQIHMVEADLASLGGETTRAIRILTECIAVFPDSAVDAFISLAHIAMDQGDTAAAVSHLDAVLEREPDHFEAINLRTGLMIREGQFQQAFQLLGRLSGKLINVIDAGFRGLQQLANHGVRERILAEFSENPESVNPGVLILLTDLLATEGKVDEVDGIVARLAKIWPEVTDVGLVRRAMARLVAGRVAEVPPLLEPLVARGFVQIDIYAVLAACYSRQGQYERQRATLQQAIDRLPGAADPFTAEYARSLSCDRSVAEALRYLDQRELIGPYCLLAKAEFLVAHGKPEEAAEICQQLIYTEDRDSLPEPGLVGARIGYSNLLISSGDIPGALEVLDSTLDLFPDNRYAIIGAAQCFASLGDEQRLRRLAQNTRSGMPGVSFQVMGVLGTVIAAKQSNPAALLNELKQYPDRLELLLAMEALLANQGQMAKVSEWMTQAERVVPGVLVELQSLRQHMLAESGEVFLEQLLRQTDLSDPANAQSALAAADVLASHGRIEEAIATLESVRKARADLIPLVQNLQARILLQAERLEEASAILAPVLSGEAPLSLELVEPCDILLAKQGATEDRIRFWRRVAESLPEQRSAAIERIAVILLEAKRSSEALAAVEELPDPGPSTLFLKAEILRRLERYDEALALAASVESALGTSGVLRALAADVRGNIWRDRNNPDKALQAYEAAIGYNPDFASSYDGISLALEELGRCDEAYEALMNAIALNPSLAAQCTTRLQRLRSGAQ